MVISCSFAHQLLCLESIVLHLNPCTWMVHMQGIWCTCKVFQVVADRISLHRAGNLSVFQGSCTSERSYPVLILLRSWRWWWWWRLTVHGHNRHRHLTCVFDCFSWCFCNSSHMGRGSRVPDTTSQFAFVAYKSSEYLHLFSSKLQEHPKGT